MSSRTQPAPPWALGPRGLALLDAAVRGGRLDRGAALVLGDWLEENDRDRLAAEVRALAGVGLFAAGDWLSGPDRDQPANGYGPPAAGPWGLSASWGWGLGPVVSLYVAAAVVWLPARVGGREVLCREFWCDVNRGGAGRGPPGRAGFALWWSYPLARCGLEAPPDDSRLYLDVPHDYPLDALAGVAYEAVAAVLLGRLLARLLGRCESPEGEVIVRA
jgi:hypothetical protein